MTGLTPFEESCLFGYIIGQVPTIGRKRSSETYLRIALGETTEYVSIWETIHRGYTLTKWTRAIWMSFDDHWTSCINLAEFDHPQVRMEANGEWHICVDYRALNTRTVRDRYPLPSIKSILSTLGGSTVFSKIDLVSGFHQIRIHDEDVEKTAFNTQFWAFEWVVMPSSLGNVPSTFQRVVNDVLPDHLGIFVWVYIDDILVFTKIAEEHQQHLDLVHELLPGHQLFPCIHKSTFFQARVPFCGYTIDKDGVHMDPEKIKVSRGWPPPNTAHEVRQFIRLCGFYQQFVEGFQAVAAPLTAMFKADCQWGWTAVHQAAFNKQKQAIINATHWSAIDPRQPYHLYTDASKDCMAATLAQRCAHEKCRDIFVLLLLCRGRCNLLKLDTRFENRGCWSSC